MILKNATPTFRRWAGADLSTSLGLAIVLLFFAASGYISYANTRALSRNALMVTHTHQVITALSDLLSLNKDAETGQRGYLITGDEKYLEPYKAAVAGMNERVNDIARMTQDNPEQQNRLPSLKSHIGKKLAELDETIRLRRNEGFESALEVVVTDRGKSEMDLIRSEISGMQEAEQNLRKARLEEMDKAYKLAVSIGIFAALLGIFLSVAVALLIRRAGIARRREEWLQTGQVGLGNAMFGEQRIELLGESILKYLADYFNAQAGAFFIRDGSIYRRVAMYGVPADGKTPEKFSVDDGLLGRAAKDGKNFVLQDVPEGYLTIGSALGQSSPRHLLIMPAISDEVTNAVIELGFLQPVNGLALQMLDRVSEIVAVAVKSASYRAHLQSLLEETQRQSEELQSQSEELRVNNEELEEQSRALKESQTRLEQQQAELEQTNAQLEEQAQLLEGQRDDIAKANAVVQLKANELERASQYKSDFLANMSHELRTPLNSSLILAKLLADNPKGNLSDEQVKFAQTIQSSGNDLLALINDILDLSKIEAGHMEVRPESVPLDRLLSDLTRMFEPVAKNKDLAFAAIQVPNCPATIETDRLRLEQILKNLLSNAIKFTEKGTVSIAIDCAKAGFVSFTVADTGIGIADEQQQSIFEAFRQADGTISRKYGGTGLGLSISRELTRLLGGTIELQSTPGKGSLFILSLPHIYDPEMVTPRVNDPVPEPANIALPVSASSVARKKTAATAVMRRVADDREKLTSGKRIILVVEDDASFAQILYGLARELDFQCLVAHTAEEALVVAKQYLPSAVVLDVGLPDNSGLTVLDRLKRDARTRHIPVHVISANDYAQTAMSLGAVGYLLKPVKREQLIETMKNFETKLEQRLRRVLIVEDDEVQRDSMRKLLGSHEVETVAVGTAAECLAQLKDHTFDCMVLDLSLPDASGYQLLETLSREDAYSFPPVIVYTGRDLSTDQEQQLRRYSKSIIIKGVKSPERLLDEVTLFLHQVVADLPAEQQKMLEHAHNRDAVLEGRNILIVEDDVRNVYALTNILEPRGAVIYIARNGKEALAALDKQPAANPIDLVLMDVMMPEMDGMVATREIRKRKEWQKLPVIMLTAKAMRDDQERCLEAGANDYMAKPLDVEKLLSLVRVWMPR